MRKKSMGLPHIVRTLACVGYAIYNHLPSFHDSVVGRDPGPDCLRNPGAHVLDSLLSTLNSTHLAKPGFALQHFLLSGCECPGNGFVDVSLGYLPVMGKLQQNKQSTQHAATPPKPLLG